MIYIVDTWNNNKVKEFANQKDALRWIDNKRDADSWKQNFDSFEDYEDGFFFVTQSVMDREVSKKGSRVLKYYN